MTARAACNASSLRSVRYTRVLAKFDSGRKGFLFEAGYACFRSACVFARRRVAYSSCHNMKINKHQILRL